MASKDQKRLVDIANAIPSNQTALTAATADAPAGGTGATAGAYDSAANRNIAIAKINNNSDRIAEIEDILQTLGILPPT